MKPKELGKLAKKRNIKKQLRELRDKRKNLKSTSDDAYKSWESAGVDVNKVKEWFK